MRGLLHALPVVIAMAASSADAQVIKVLSGQWSGMAHFSAKISENGRSLEDPTANAHVEIYMTIDKQGNVSGRTISNGCQIRGLATPWMNDNSLDLQLNFSGCQHAGFNRRFTGHLLYRPNKRNADITLHTTDMSALPNRIGSYRIQGNMQL